MKPVATREMQEACRHLSSAILEAEGDTRIIALRNRTEQSVISIIKNQIDPYAEQHVNISYEDLHEDCIANESMLEARLAEATELLEKVWSIENETGRYSNAAEQFDDAFKLAKRIDQWRADRIKRYRDFIEEARGAS